MRSLCACVVAWLGLVVCSIPAWAELCEKCRGRMYTQDIGECISCGGYTTSGAFKLCPKCSAAQKRCEHCLAPLKAVSTPQKPKPQPPTVPPAPQPEKPEPIRLDRSHTYVWQQWKYEFKITAPGTRSEGRWGTLYFAGRQLPPAEINDYYETPWGKIYWVGTPDVRWGDHAWMPRPKPGSDRRPRRLAPPAATAPGSQLSFTMADNGKQVAVPAGAVLTIRLEGNITTGYGWQVGKLEGEALELLGKPEYVQRPHRPGMVGVGGVFVFKLKAVKPGKANMQLVYVRPWEKDKPPARTFSLDVQVNSPPQPLVPRPKPPVRPLPRPLVPSGQ